MKRRGSLADLAARLGKTRSDLEATEAALVAAARDRAAAISKLSEEYDDPAGLAAKRNEIGATERAPIGQREALQEAVSELETRCAALAVGEAEEKVEGLRKRLVPFARERSEIEARLVAIQAEEDEIELEIAEAVDAVRWAAAPFSADAKARADGLLKQENERVAWLARHANRSQIEQELERETPRFRRLLAEEIAKVDAERGERRQKLAADSAESLAAVGLTVDVDPNEVREGQPFPRLIR